MVTAWGVRVSRAIRAVVSLIAAVCSFGVLASPISAANTSVLIMGGTGHPLATPPDTLEFVQQYLNTAVNNYVAPSALHSIGIPNGPYNAVAVVTPERSTSVVESVAEGVAALHSCLTSAACDHNPGVGSEAPAPADTFVVFGYSQSAAIAMLEKAALAATYSPGEGPKVSFVVIGNARPNGGMTTRDIWGFVTQLLFNFPVAEQDHTPPLTNTQYSTVDVAVQYDGLADHPLNPLNLLADLNAYAGLHLHRTYSDRTLTEPGIIDQGQHGDTHYYLVPTPILPLLMPLEVFGPLGHALADTLDAPLRVIIESAFDRTVSPGVPTPWDLTYFPNPATFARNLIMSIPTGMDNGIQDLVGARPFGTVRPGPYGVGGPDVTHVVPDVVTPITAAPPASRRPAVAASARPKVASAQRASKAHKDSNRRQQSTAGSSRAHRTAAG